MKKFFFIVAFLGCALVYLQQQTYAEKIAHKEYATMAIKDCNDCHKGEGIALNHDADFVRGHRVLASKAGNNCYQCHEQKWCLDCHQGGGTGDNLSQNTFGRDYKPKSHRSDWISIHPIKSQDNPQQCYRCHEAKAFCTACHSRLPQNTLKSLGFKSHDNQLGAGWGFEHATEARRSLQSCQTCHSDGDTCKKCHSSGGVSPHPRGFKAGNFRDRSSGKVCLQCHLSGRF
ncbi:MAG: cytochrome C [Desulfuromonadales bacterium]|nr:cytochrome C [Desulfuromonadales bacterium]